MRSMKLWRTDRVFEMQVVVADANVLYSNVQRNVLMTLAVERLFALRWTLEIEAEWVRNLAANRPDLDPASVRRTADLMRRALPNAEIANYLVHVGKLQKTDEKDKHVAAAAVMCSPSTLITWNLKDFNSSELTGLDVALVDPDTFLCSVFDEKPEVTFAAAEKSFSFYRRSDPKRNWDAYVDVIGSSGKPNCLQAFAARLRGFTFEDKPSDPSDDPSDPDVPDDKDGP